MRPLIIIGFLFFVFGFVTWMSSVLVPYLQIACELDQFESQLVAFAFYISYFVMAVPSGYLLKKSGLKNGMAIGLLVMALGAFIFIPAAQNRQYLLFLIGLFVQGTGLAILQTASNPYVTILGPMESAAKRISVMGICNGIAGILGPAVLGVVLLDGVEELAGSLTNMASASKAAALDVLAQKVILPYIIIGIALFALAVFIIKSSLPEISEPEESTEKSGPGMTSIWQFPHLILGVLTLFLYTGVEVIAGNTIIGYATFQGIPMSSARFFTSFTLTSMLAGYLIGIFAIPRWCSQENALKISAVSGIIFSIAALVSVGWLSVFFIALLGLANALMWPSIWPLAIRGLGSFTNTGSAMLVMAIAGGAVLPLVYGKLADLYSPHTGYLILIPCYLFILYYAVSGHQAGTRIKHEALAPSSPSTP